MLETLNRDFCMYLALFSNKVFCIHFTLVSKQATSKCWVRNNDFFNNNF